MSHYDMTLRVAQAEIIPGHRTPVRGYNGRFPGPAIEARSGRRAVDVRQEPSAGSTRSVG